ncbi:hypothetical protein MPSEU_000785500 [Mayamaea pseudoterrestris]|nr:hypothetical protein MPSEU_000785500 [Mayamaea pseudoterrestris]
MAKMMVHRMMRRLLVVALLLLGKGVQAFQQLSGLQRPVSLAPSTRVSSTNSRFGASLTVSPSRSFHHHSTVFQASRLFNLPEHNDRSKRSAIRRYLSRKFQRTSVLLQSVVRACMKLSFALSLFLAVTMSTMRPQPAHASAPVMVMPKGESRDPIVEAMSEYKRSQVKVQQDELRAFAKKCREIEATEGEGARVKFEQEYKQQQIKKAEQMAQGLEQLKRNLLEQGIDPYVDMEGQRQTTFYKEGVDLGEVAGTPFNVENVLQSRNSKQSQAYRLRNNRKIIALIAKDMRNRGIDPLEYFSTHQDNTICILEIPTERAAQMAAQFEANLEEYGQVIPPKNGETSVKEQNPKSKSQRKLVAKVQQAKPKVAKLNQKKRKVATKADQKMHQAASKLEETKQQAVNAAKSVSKTVAPKAKRAALTFRPNISKDHLVKKALPAAAAFVAIGGGGLAFKVYRDKAAREEEERQRQFRLIMGDASGTETKRPKTSTSMMDVDDEEWDLDIFNGSKPSPKAASAPAPSPAPVKLPLEPAPKKKRLGLKNVFNRNKTGRETDIAVLVAPDAEAPEFATLLAKLLTFGAPGRFPRVQALPGDMPMPEFDLESAKQKLINAREKADLDLVSSAEIFANVVNCMLINIIDLAAVTLKEKDTKVQVEALDVAIQFIMHAASMYDAVADGVVIAPVTYEGDLGRGKLESLYSAYAGSMMSNPKDDFDSRLQSLQDIFKISDKKAEGLMMSAVQKNMMEMMKNGEKMEGMEEMMASMGSMAGVDGLNLEDGNYDLDKVKQMLLGAKQLKDSGAFSKDDLANIKKEFDQTFGATMEEMANPLDAETKEILELMKSIFDD